MTTGLARISLDAILTDLRRRYARVRGSLCGLQNQESAYAEEHRALLACYHELQEVVRRHLGALGPEPNHSFPGRVQEREAEAPTGPKCPGCIVGVFGDPRDPGPAKSCPSPALRSPSSRAPWTPLPCCCPAANWAP